MLWSLDCSLSLISSRSFQISKPPHNPIAKSFGQVLRNWACFEDLVAPYFQASPQRNRKGFWSDFAKLGFGLKYGSLPESCRFGPTVWSRVRARDCLIFQGFEFVLEVSTCIRIAQFGKRRGLEEVLTAFF